jgi:ligand-binding sensor domain-containing protein
MNTVRSGVAMIAVALGAAGTVLVADARPPRLNLPEAQIISTRNSSLADDAILDITVSPANEIWVATARGITIIGRDGKMRHSDQHGQKLCYQVVFAPDGAAWIHCGLAILSEQNGSTWVPVELPAQGYSVMDIDFDSLGQPWVATNAGLFARIGDEWKLVPVPHTGVLKFSAVGCAAAEPEDFMLAHVTGYGVVRINVRTFAHETLFLEEDSGCPLRVDRAGNAWFATRQELYRIAAGERTGERAPIAALKVVDIAFDHRDRPWISTRLGGILTFDGGRWVAVAPEQRRSGDDELGRLPLAFDREGNLWAGGAISHYFRATEGTGLLRMPPAQLPP